MGEWLEVRTAQRGGGGEIGRVTDNEEHKIMYVLVAWGHNRGRQVGRQVHGQW